MEKIRLSVSKTKEFITCKKKYNFSYNLKIPKAGEQEHLTFGKFLHQVLENFHQDLIDGVTQPLNKIMSIALKKALPEYQDKLTQAMYDEGLEILKKYLKIFLEKPQPNILAVEKNFDLILADNISITGMIDRIQIDHDNILHVADYKTTKNAKYLKNDFFQLLTYAYVMLIEDPTLEKIRASYIMLRHNMEEITLEFSQDQILAIKDQYIDYAHKILAETEFPANPTNLCGWCDYLSLCQEGQNKINPIKTNGEIEW